MFIEILFLLSLLKIAMQPTIIKNELNTRLYSKILCLKQLHTVSKKLCGYNGFSCNASSLSSFFDKQNDPGNMNKFLEQIKLALDHYSLNVYDNNIVFFYKDRELYIWDFLTQSNFQIIKLPELVNPEIIKNNIIVSMGNEKCLLYNLSTKQKKEFIAYSKTPFFYELSPDQTLIIVCYELAPLQYVLRLHQIRSGDLLKEISFDFSAMKIQLEINPPLEFSVSCSNDNQKIIALFRYNHQANYTIYDLNIDRKIQEKTDYSYIIAHPIQSQIIAFVLKNTVIIQDIYSKKQLELKNENIIEKIHWANDGNSLVACVNNNDNYIEWNLLQNPPKATYIKLPTSLGVYSDDTQPYLCCNNHLNQLKDYAQAISDVNLTPEQMIFLKDIEKNITLKKKMEVTDEEKKLIQNFSLEMQKIIRRNIDNDASSFHKNFN